MPGVLDDLFSRLRLIDSAVDARLIGNRIADCVAQLAASYDEEVLEMFNSIRSLPAESDWCGFECHVNPQEALAWFAAHPDRWGEDGKRDPSAVQPPAR